MRFVCRRRHLVLPTQGGRAKGAGSLTEEVCEVRFDAAPGEDTADRIWAVCRGKCEAKGQETSHVRFSRIHAHLRTQPEREVRSTREDDPQATPSGVAGGRPMVSSAPARSCGQATANPERQAPRPLPILRAPDELSKPSAVLSGRPSHLVERAESPHTWAMVDVGAVCRNPAAASFVATSDYPFLAEPREDRLKNPLR